MHTKSPSCIKIEVGLVVSCMVPTILFMWPTQEARLEANCEPRPDVSQNILYMRSQEATHSRETEPRQPKSEQTKTKQDPSPSHCTQSSQSKVQRGTLPTCLTSCRAIDDTSSLALAVDEPKPVRRGRVTGLFP